MVAVQKVGRSFTYIEVGPGTADLSTGVVTPSKTPHVLMGVLTKVEWRLVDDSTVKWTDEMLLVDAVSFEEELGAGAKPSTDDLVLLGSDELSIQLVRSISSGEEWALHKLVVRR